jgi:diguanylate cyclase (GGDEF)-like protein
MSRSWRSEVEPPESDHSPRALVLLYRLLSLDEVERIREAVVEGVEWLAAADAVSLWESGPDGLHQTARRGAPLEADGMELERRLVELPGPARSSLERHQGELDQISRNYRDRGRLCHVRPLRAFGDRIGSVGFHCFHRRELTFGELQALRQFSDAAGVALRSARERDELRRLAYTDPLTGLANRRKIDDVLEALGDRPVSVLFVDFDGLKGVNDNVSYEVGDSVIQAVGELLRAQVGDDWIPGRLGGDEFVIVLPGADIDRAAAQARDLRLRLDSLAVPAEAARHFGGASVGWATAVPNESRTTLLRRASDEMKAAKHERRGGLQPPAQPGP